ncbi:alpha/beta hydrolase [Pyricularia oryzae]|uniref:Alpha/beta hydrolase n=1 Tax=Pyricularia oryzae (strain Y34) TaxID=1143189 RepID=A0AA97NTK4_PYRO3|nr:alpha/beta hydrolase [Pyricularia oryzae Y34]KAI7912609.1 alpha/beta hydrolase [Pyricularia oryzae]KAI7920770.1 alpha/beta hydrolase [Pyricularia oryzae]
METKTIVLPDGRNLAYAVLGDVGDDKPTVFHLHGFPGSHHEAAIYAPAAARHGIRLVGISRPGMGGSTFQPERRILDWPADVRALADHLRTQGPFGVLGISGGGPYAWACWRSGAGGDPDAALPRSMLAACAVVGGLGPPSFGFGGLPASSRAIFWLSQWSTGLVGAGLDYAMGKAARGRPEQLAASIDDMYLSGSRGEADKEVWGREEFAYSRRALLDSLTAAMSEPGAPGPAWEARVLGAPWGFGLDELGAAGEGRVVVWHGGQDLNVPVDMARRSAALVQGAECKIWDSEAHASMIVRSADHVIEALALALTTASWSETR